MFGALGTVWAEMGLDTTKLDMGVARAAASMKALQGHEAVLTKAMKGAAIGIGVVGAAVAAGAIKLAADYDKNMRKVWSLTTESEATFKKWKTEVLDLASKLPQSASQMADAFYWVKSDMPDATDAEQLKTLEVAAKGAVGGVAELSETTNALVQAQNAYGETNPAKYMDIMNKAVERGSIELKDFVAFQGQVVGSAAMAGVSFEEVAAAVSTLTRKAVPAETAFMALNNTIMAYLKPQDDAVETASKYGIELSLATLRSKGLAASLMEIANKVPDEELAKMFPNIRALRAVLPLAGIAAGDFAVDLAAMGAAAGTTDRMYEKNANTIQNKWRIAVGKAEDALIKLGDKALPAVSGWLDAISNALSGKNEAFNTFATVMGTAAKGVWNLADALLKMWPILAMVAGGFAAIKLGGFIASIASAATKIPLLNNVISNLGLGFTASTASVGGLATSIGTIGLMAAPAAIAVALLVKQWRDADAAGEAAATTIRKNDQALSDLGLQLQPLVDRYEELRATTNRSTAQQAEMVQIGNQVAGLAPRMSAGFDAMGNAILKSDTQLKQLIEDMLKYSGITIKEEGAEGQLEGLTKSIPEFEKQAGKLGNQISYIGTELRALGVDETDVRNVVNLLKEDFANGSTSVEAYIQSIKDAGLSGAGWKWEAQAPEMTHVNAIAGALSVLNQRFKENKMSFQDWKDKVGASTAAISQLTPKILESAMAAGRAGDAFSSQLAAAFTSISPQMQQLGVQSFSAYIQGLSQGQIAPDMANQLAQQMFNTGTFTATGVDSVNKALEAMAARMRASSLASAAKSVADTVSKIFGSIGGGKAEEKKVTLKVGDAGTAAATNKSLKQVQAQATTLGGMKPNVHTSANTAQANAAISRLVNRLSGMNGQTLATVYIQAKITGSGPFTADEYVSYLEDKIGGAAPNLTVGATLGGSFEDLTKAWAAMNATALPGWSTGRMAPTGDMSIDEWNHINEAIANLGGNVEANLKGWWNMNGALIEAKKSMAEYTKATEAAELVVEGLQAQETKLNASLSAHKERLSTLSSMKIKGEGAASDKSFRQEQAINRLELERLKIQQKARAGKATTADYNRLFVIAQQQKELELQKEIDDKATDLKYADKKRQLEKLLDPLKGQEKSYAALVKAIKQEQRVIAVKEKQLKSVQKTLEKERAKVAELKKAYDKISRSVDVFATKINEMAANFRARYDEMIAKAKELADAIEEAKKKEAGGSMGSTMASPNLAGAGTRMSATNNTTNNKSTAVSYFYFDKLVLNGVQDVPSLTQELRMAKLRVQV